MYVLEQEKCVLIFLDYISKFKLLYIFLKSRKQRPMTKFLKIYILQNNVVNLLEIQISDFYSQSF